MTSQAESTEAPIRVQRQRLELGQFLMVDQQNATPAELETYGRMKAAIAAGDGAAYDAFLADPKVGELFNRGILGFRAAP